MRDVRTSSFEITGLDALERQIAQLDAYAHRDVVVGALKDGAEVIAGAARANVPEREGRLKRAIRVRMGRAGRGRFSVLCAVGKRWFTGKTFYGAFQEFGWKAGKRGKGNRKEIPGEHFMEHAFEEKKDQAMAAVVVGLKRRAADASKTPG